MNVGNYIWILKSKGEESAFGGNEGYEDQIGTSYVYDTTVKNHNKIFEGDIIVIAGKNHIEGFACIQTITKEDNVPKRRYRCPECNTQEHYERKSITPKYKCRNKHEFDTPLEENLFVDQFTASYKETYIAASPKTSVKLLDNYYVRRNLYYSIQPAKTDFLSSEFPLILKQLLSGVQVLRSDTDFFDQSFLEIDDYVPSALDTRKSRIAKAISREGQSQFREVLFKYYGVKCMLTGCEISQVIEAGHINPYRGKKDNHPANGLLFRRDLHSIFDCNLLGLHPKTLEIYIHPSLKSSEYASLEGKTIIFSKKGFSPSRDALEIRWKLFQENLLQKSRD